MIQTLSSFSRFDSHEIISNLHKVKHRIFRMTSIPANQEKFKVLSLNNLVFADSTAFLPSSLEKLVDNLNASHHEYPLLRQWVKEKDKRDMLLRKGVFPYSFVRSAEQMRGQKEIPSKEHFFNELKQEHVSDEDYSHACTVWKAFNCENLADYCSLYCSSDVYLLSEAVMSMKNMLFDQFGLDMSHYISLPHMTKDIMLAADKDMQIRYMHDPEMVAMVQNGIRGGFSFINTRYFDTNATSAQIGAPVSALYADVNNLYGHAMQMKLPVDDFRWLDKHEIDKFDIMSQDPNDEYGFIAEVSLRYPERLHKLHSSFPLAPETIEIGKEDLSEDAEELWKYLRGGNPGKMKKLTATFRDRNHYVIHGLNLKLALELGLELIEVHRVMTFRQEAVLKNHILTCSRERACSKTVFMSNLWKLLSNRCDGLEKEEKII